MGACYVSISFCGRSIGLPLIIHEHFCCNRGFAATTSLNAVSPASRQAGSPLAVAQWGRVLYSHIGTTAEQIHLGCMTSRETITAS